jgi:hypothetical protein
VTLLDHGGFPIKRSMTRRWNGKELIGTLVRVSGMVPTVISPVATDDFPEKMAPPVMRTCSLSVGAFQSLFRRQSSACWQFLD